jgi:putative transposase
MTRPLRLQFPGAIFHGTSRGTGQQDIFLDDDDREHFLELLGKCVDRYDWILLAYVLMTNHFHLVLQLTCETLSLGFKWLNGQYADYFNRRHTRVGHLIQGRPHAPLIEDGDYFLNVLRYAVLNPVRANIVAKPEDYRWSSHRAVLGLAEAPKWLAVDDVLSNFAPQREIARARYQCFVDAGMGGESPWKHLVGQVFLGGPEWIAKMRGRIDLKPRSDDHPRVQRQIGGLPMAVILETVAGAFGIDVSEVRRLRKPRLIATWLACHEGLLTNRQIAAGLRLRSDSYVSRLVRESEQEANSDPSLQVWIDDCISTLRRNLGQIAGLTPIRY